MRLEEHFPKAQKALMKRLHWRGFALLALLTCVIGLATIPTLAQSNSGNRFEARIYPIGRDGRNSAQIQGEGHVYAVLWGKNQLSISGQFMGLASNATAVKLKRSVAAGARGTDVADLNLMKQHDGTFWGTVALTDSQVADLRGFRLYLHLDSQSAPEGNLWGWLQPVD